MSASKSKAVHPVTKLAWSSKSKGSNHFDMPPLEVSSRIQILGFSELLRAPVRASLFTPWLDLCCRRRARIVTPSPAAIGSGQSYADPWIFGAPASSSKNKAVHLVPRLALSSKSNSKVSNPFDMPPLEMGSRIQILGSAELLRAPLRASLFTP